MDNIKHLHFRMDVYLAKLEMAQEQWPSKSKPSDCRGDDLCFCVHCLDVGKKVNHPEKRA